MQIWLMLIVLCVHMIQGCDECQPCDCNIIQISGRMLCSANCSHRGLTSLPHNIPQEVQHLDLSNNQLTNADLQGLERYTEFLLTLIISHNNITYIPPGSLSTASILQELNLEGNILEYVNSSSFGYLKQLRKLLGIHSLYFDDDTFENLKGLDELSVVFDSKLVSENILNHLKLKTLVIEFRLATSIPKNMFRFGVDTLLNLQLSAPNVESLHEDTFSGLTILKSVTIRTKTMHTLPSYIFHPSMNDNRKMPVNLVTVKIDGVKSLPRNLFDKQQSLKYLALNNIEDLILSNSESQVDTLDLSGSALYRIKSDWFSGFKSLRFLNLSKTQLTELGNETLNALSSLTVLDLSFNNIKYLPAGLFRSSRNTLVALNVSYNQIQNVSANTFEAVKSLEKLDMGHNSLHYIDENAFKDLFMLTELLLDDNELIYISSDTLVDQSSLMEISIARNKIKQLPARLFRNTRSLRRLDISGNEIQTLPYNFFQSVRHLEFVSLGGNPVHCDCSLMLLRDRMPRVNLLGRCEAPPDLLGTSLADLKLNDSCLVAILSTSFQYSDSSLIMSTLDLNHFPTNLLSTPYELASTVRIASTSAGYLYPTIVRAPDRDIPEAAKGSDAFYNTFMGTTAFYIAIGVVAAVFGGSTIAVVVMRARRKMRSRAYNINEGNEMQEGIEVQENDEILSDKNSSLAKDFEG